MDPFALFILTTIILGVYVRTTKKGIVIEKKDDQSDSYDLTGLSPDAQTQITQNLSVQKHTPVSVTNNMLRELSNYMGTDVARAKMEVSKIARKVRNGNPETHELDTSIARSLLQTFKKEQRKEHDSRPMDTIYTAQQKTNVIFRDRPMLMPPDSHIYGSHLLHSRD